jgi:ubiquinone/menaquinone biosynthesis C-methylase UbiE
MISAARRRAAKAGIDVTFEIGDALVPPSRQHVRRLPDRDCQHLADPGQAVAEMARVARLGGRIAALEFDLGTVFLDHPDAELSETIRTSFTNAAVQGSTGRQLPRLLVAPGSRMWTQPHV